MSATSTRVTHVIPDYLPARGGIEALIDAAAPVLSSCHGVTSSIVVSRLWRERPQHFTHNGVEVISIPITQRYWQVPAVHHAVRTFRDVRRNLTTLRPDIVHVHGIDRLFIPVGNVARSLGIPVVYHLHGCLPEAISHRYGTVLRDAEHCVVVSDAVASDVRTRTGRTEPIMRITNGLPDTEVKPATPDHPHLVLVGRLDRAKGFDQGFDVASLLVSRFPDLRVSVIGAGESLVSLQRHARELGIDHRVRFHGRLPREESLRIVARASVVLVPSLHTEGFSLVALEAALLEKPVVAYRVGGLSETVLDGVTGSVVDIGDRRAMAAATARYLDDPVMSRRVGRMARERARTEFNIATFAERLAAYYASVLGGEMSGAVDER